MAKEQAEQHVPIGNPTDDAGIEPTIHDLPLDSAGGDPTRSEAGSSKDDHWIMRGDYVVRVHTTPRRALFTPFETKDAPPIPVSEIDVVRRTTTNLENADEKCIEDFWMVLHLTIIDSYPSIGLVKHALTINRLM